MNSGENSNEDLFDFTHCELRRKPVGALANLERAETIPCRWRILFLCSRLHSTPLRAPPLRVPLSTRGALSAPPSPCRAQCLECVTRRAGGGGRRVEGGGGFQPQLPPCDRLIDWRSHPPVRVLLATSPATSRRAARFLPLLPSSLPLSLSLPPSLSLSLSTRALPYFSCNVLTSSLRLPSFLFSYLFFS
ncbi:hypothetical protein R5R35_011109 [Gryllus longicercus]|uniref:Uncharacterized protein n=1 Tax=Gryllus longicercus TaxID=2509291 RepID=A0AAN9V2U7_9ORTH